MQFAYANSSATVKADVLVVPAFEESNPLAGYSFGAAVTKASPKSKFKGKAGSSLMFPSNGTVSATWVVLLGLGKTKDANVQKIGETLANIFRSPKIDSLNIKHVAIALEVASKVKGIDTQDLARWCAEAAMLGGYQFNALISKKDKIKARAAKVTLAGASGAELKKGVAVGEVTSQYTAHARDLVNEPSNRINPATLAKFAQQMAAKVPGLTCKVLKKPEIEKLKMGAFLGVNAGSKIPAHLIILVPERSVHRGKRCLSSYRTQELHGSLPNFRVRILQC